jgi:hypothetical protein
MLLECVPAFLINTFQIGEFFVEQGRAADENKMVKTIDN